MTIRVELADDDYQVRKAMRQLLDGCSEFAVVAEATSGHEAVELARQQRPDVAVVDVGMPDLNGIAAASLILQCSPRTSVLILTIHHDERRMIRALEAGARGYVLKDSVEYELIPAIQRLRQGKWFFSTEVAQMLHESFLRDPRSKPSLDPHEQMTIQERQIYRWLAEGLGTKEIAARLELAEGAVEAYRVQIMRELRLANSSELLLSAVRRGLVA
jgi:DNA-binding NarL/FixJ family response regulator